MITIPFVGRLYVAEYFALILSFCFLIFESIIRVITACLPTTILDFFYIRSKWLFNAFAPFKRTIQSAPKRERSVAESIKDSEDFVEMCRFWGYRAEEYIVRTEDGYLLALHRVLKEGTNRKDLKGRRVVYLHHGLMMNSDVWVCLVEKEKCLPFQLVEKGYDVWLGNNRGNKYSKKHLFYPSNTRAFWDFSMDQFAIHDIPDAIAYILNVTKSKSVSFIGFSQGSAQAFAALSISPTLNEQVDVLIGIGPAMSPPGLHNPIVDAFIRASPNVLFLLFGRKSLLSSATFWQSIFYPPLFVRIIDASLKFLFGWHTENISLPQKLAAYSHLYSFTSVKSVVHWFQIIRNKSFQMYDDDLQSLIGFYGTSFYKVARFPTKNIVTPITLLYGGSDSLVDIDVMLKELPPETVAKEIKHYEHLDFLWAKDVDTLVFPEVFAALDRHSLSKEGELGVPLYSSSNSDIALLEEARANAKRAWMGALEGARERKRSREHMSTAEKREVVQTLRGMQQAEKALEEMTKDREEAIENGLPESPELVRSGDDTTVNYGDGDTASMSSRSLDVDSSGLMMRKVPVLNLREDEDSDVGRKSEGELFDD